MDDFLTGVHALRWHIGITAFVILFCTVLYYAYRPYDPRKGVRDGRNRNRGPDDPR